MIKRIKRLLTTLSLSGMLIFPVFAPAAVYAQSTDCLDNPDSGGIQECLDSGSCATDPDSCPENDDATDRVNNIIKLIINVFSLIVGVISVIMIIIGGLKYIMSGGNDSNVAGAKNTILYAVIGLVIVALAQVIVRFVLTRVSTDA